MASLSLKVLAVRGQSVLPSGCFSQDAISQLYFTHDVKRAATLPRSAAAMYDAALLLSDSGILQYVSSIPVRFRDIVPTPDTVLGTSYLDWVEPIDRIRIERALAAASMYARPEKVYVRYRYSGRSLHSLLTIDRLDEGHFLLLSSHVPYACRSLTARQQEVLAWSGRPSQEAAVALGIRPSSVDSHRARLRAILGVACDCDLRGIGRRLGLV